YWKDTGTPEDIIHANGAILENMTPYFFGEKESQVTIEGNVMIGKGTIVKSGTSITGPAIIGKDCKIGPNVSIGPNTSIGDNSEISRCNIENSIIMSGCKINGDFSIRDSIIAFNAEITKSNTPNKVFLLGEGTRISL
ncbi:MAG: glucose-1-phosphate thymidylyltransferase, partial [Nitrosopumilaceae archaeon]|nr:glucose-1-phosphate thymidylyltransferase [Nitrosopumilaceae archaeon]